MYPDVHILMHSRMSLPAAYDPYVHILGSDFVWDAEQYVSSINMNHLNLPSRFHVSWRGIPNASLADLNTQFQQYVSWPPPPDVVIMDIGTDILATAVTSNLMADELAQHIVNIADTFITRGAKTVAIMYVLPRISGGPHFNRYANVYNDKLAIYTEEKRAQGSDIRVWDFGRLANLRNADRFFAADGFNLSNRGLEVYCGLIRKCIFLCESPL